MIKRNLWKIISSLAVVIFCVTSLIPLQDRDFVDFVKIEARTKKAEFNTLAAEAVARKAAGQSRTAYLALKEIASERKIDLQKEYFPGIPVGRSQNIDTKNDVLLKHLLKESKAKLQLGLDLKGGVAFTLELDPKATANLDADSLAKKLDEAKKIIERRIDAFGVTEPDIRTVGNNRLEVQLPGVNTRDDPGIVDSLQKPAMLEFRLVHPEHPYVRPTGQPGEEIPAGYEILVSEETEDGRTETLFVKRIPMADGKIIDTAYATLDQYNNPEIRMNFTSEGRSRFAAATREVAEYTRQLRARTGDQRVRACLAIVLDGNLKSYPGVESEIDNGSAVITGRFTPQDAQNLAAVLNNPLDVPMHVREQTEKGPSLAEDAISSGLRASVIGAALVVAFMIVFYWSGGLLAVVMLAVNMVIIFGVMANFNATLTLPGLAGIVLTIGMAVDANILIFERMREEINAGKSLSSANHAGFAKALWTILDAHFVQLLICTVMITLGTGPIRGFGVTLAIGVCSTLFSVLITGHMILEFLIDGGALKKITMRHLLRRAPHWDFVKWGKHAFVASWVVVLVGVGMTLHTGRAIYGIDFAGGELSVLKFNQEHKVDISKIRAAATQAGMGEIQLSYARTIGQASEVLRVQSSDNDRKLAESLQQKFPEAKFAEDGKLNETEKGLAILFLKLEKQVDLEKIRAAARDAGIGAITPSYVRDTKTGETRLRIEREDKLLPTLKREFPASQFELDSKSSVGASIGKEVLRKAIFAVLIAMIVTLLYIAFRFEFGFGVGAMFSSLHDILMAIGLFVIVGHGVLGFQFSAPMVAAILAIAGYSINETVVVFDRIREELRINQGGTLRDIVNTAINKVFARTIMTSTTTLLASIPLFILGSGELQEIAFTFTVGIITATFSAIFISSQVFYWYHKGDRKRVEKHQDAKPTYEWTGASKASE